jgi:hypothetical protein
VIIMLTVLALAWAVLRSLRSRWDESRVTRQQRQAPD